MVYGWCKVNLAAELQAELIRGQSFPLGAIMFPDGVNFSVFSKNSTAIELLLFDTADQQQPSRVIPLDPERNRTFYYWHVQVPGIKGGQLYGYRVYGPNDPIVGHRFDPQKVLLDPYAKAVAVGSHYSRQAAIRRGDNCAQAMKSAVIDTRGYDWEGDHHLQLPYSNTIVYEMHAAGFTRHPSSGVSPEKRGTYAGLVEKIPYLQELGITAVELMPVQQFDEQDVNPPLKNYWGYNPIALFAPHAGYAYHKEPQGLVNEFRDMIKSFHRAGIEVILDVVFNHTAEGPAGGPTLCFRGLENRAYYILQSDLSQYADYSGCGNTLNTNQSVVRRLILDCLRYWVSSYHVDGFRFDLASVLSRDEWGQPLKSPPILWDIESDPVLAGTKIIAEAWDAVGLYQVGSFVGHRWAEWNGQFRDDVRCFVKGDQGFAPRLAARLTGSRDLYPQPDREPNRSINFVAAHDGFTLNDLVSYDHKHNEANREDNRDGLNVNFSWNCGLEGSTDDLEIEALRLRQIKNFFTLLFISQGTPMMLMGDEIRRTQLGNNNAYCQDNELSWFDWGLLDKQAGLLRFVQKLIRFTQWHPVFREENFWLTQGIHARLSWHGVNLGQPDWSDPSYSLAFTLSHADSGDLHIMVNAYWEPLRFDIPVLPEGQRWWCIVDTSLPSPDDIRLPPGYALEDVFLYKNHIINPDKHPQVIESYYLLSPRSTAIIMAIPDTPKDSIGEAAKSP